LILLMQTEQELEAKDICSTLGFSFKVPQGIRKITVHMAYSPVRLEDQARSKTLIQEAMAAYAPWEAPDEWDHYLPLANLITLSMDDPAGYRGNAHRNGGDQTHILSAYKASLGFLPGAISPGTWRAMIHIHALVTEKCTIQLQITGVVE
jgi:hypothetical protein